MHRATWSAGSMGKGGNQGEGATEREAQMPTFSWEEIQKHNLRTDKWLVIDRKVYNVTKWSSRHPGGHRVISHYAGEDATVRVWGLSRHLPRLLEGVRSRGSQGAKQDLQRCVELGASRREGKCLLCSSPAPNPRPLGQLGQRALGVGFWSPGGRSERWRTVPDLPRALGALHPLLPPGSLGLGDSPKGALRLWRPHRERWPPLGAPERSGRGASCGTLRPSLLSPRPGGGEGKLAPGQGSLLLEF